MVKLELIGGGFDLENKYEHVYREIKAKIVAGEYEVNDKLMTESQLMSIYESSRYAVRKAIGDLENAGYVYRIQGGGIFVNDWHTVKKVTQNNKIIGVMTTHIADYIFPNIITGIDRIISEEGYTIMLSNTLDNAEKERYSLLRMLEMNLSGLIVEPTQSALINKNKDLYEKIMAQKIPVLFINSHYEDLEIPYLELNDFNGSEVATEHLINEGHGKILGIFKVDDKQGQLRMNGFVQAYMEHSAISYQSEILMYQSADSMQNIYKKIEKILHRSDRPTAIVCYNDQLAIKLIDIVKSMGMKIPEDISIVGFDDYQLSKYMSPKLTTIRHPKEKMGREAATMLLKMINSKTMSAKSVVYDAKLIIRESVKNRN
ncbi:GntR family transcriptional regulator [Dellaglioa sp. P0083]|uniref:GntR family transcriptional regulator n=1 Tax=Dellaglioa kimchii TaxID=3344667 RepID=UPI0038D49BF5